MDFYVLILSVHLVFCMIPAVVGISSYRLLTKELKILAILFVVVCLVEMVSLILTILAKNNVWIYHFYAPIEYALYVTVFSYWIKNAQIKKALRYSIAGFAILSVASSLNTGDIFKFNYFPVTVAYIIYDGVAAITLIQVFNDDWGSVFKRHLFWIASALLLLSSCNLIYFAFHDMVPPESTDIFWTAHNIINMIAYLFYAIGFVCYKRYASADQEEYLGIDTPLTGNQRFE
ncbi:MAG: hypothetical protein GY839_13050 [candidate division Zixibacteria bacterium]|nr:hypothetical protein [candidate division Zixibacteria bacterium]